MKYLVLSVPSPSHTLTHTHTQTQTQYTYSSVLLYNSKLGLSFQWVSGFTNYGQVWIQGRSRSWQEGAGHEHCPICGEDKQERREDNP